MSNHIAEPIIGRIEALANNPRPHGFVDLSGVEGYRIRIGDYRVIYKVEDDVLFVLVIEVGHRKQVYKEK